MDEACRDREGVGRGGGALGWYLVGQGGCWGGEGEYWWLEGRGDWEEPWRGRWLARKGVGVSPGGAGGLAKVRRVSLKPAYWRGF